MPFIVAPPALKESPISHSPTAPLDAEQLPNMFW